MTRGERIALRIALGAIVIAYLWFVVYLNIYGS